MNPLTSLPDRRSLLKGVTLGTGGHLLAPLLQKIAAAAEGNVTPPRMAQKMGAQIDRFSNSTGTIGDLVK